MKQLRLLIVKMIRFILVQFHRGGSLPGKIALRLDPLILTRFKTPEILVIVTGTNGKTSTSNLIVESLSASGLKVIGNRKGDNLREGIATLLCANSDYSYKIKADAVVLEVDEMSIPRVFNQLSVSSFVITNFFRDQLDRAGEMETILRKIESVLPEYKGNLILNGNDPNVMRVGDVAKLATLHTFAVERTADSKNTSNEASEGKFCPRCKKELVYDYYQYSHIGKFYCEHDNFGQIEPTVLVNAIDYERQEFMVDGVSYPSFQNAIYAIYNCCAVLCLLKTLSIPLRYASKVFKEFELNDGRNESFVINGSPCLLNLIKNPTGANEVMKGIIRDSNKKAILIVLNDRDQDGCDVSWIWDTHFELLFNDSLELVLCSGLRANDMGLRLKYLDHTTNIHVEEGLDEAIKRLSQCNASLYVLSTYTALQPVRAALRRVSE